MTIPVLVCAPASDAVLVCRGTVFTHSCSRCTRRVTMAPNGQAFMRRNPKAVIICFYCYRALPEANMEMTGWIQSDGTVSDDISAVKNELQNAVPNTWRERN
jgi:hypothetical protein